MINGQIIFTGFNFIQRLQLVPEQLLVVIIITTLKSRASDF